MALPIVTGEFGVVGKPDVRFTTEGKPWIKIRGLAKAKKRGANGAWTDGESMFIDILVFDEEKVRMASHLVEQNLADKDSIVVSGRLQMREYEKDGHKRISYQITADSVGLSLRWKHYNSGDPLKVDSIKEILGAEQLEDAPF